MTVPNADISVIVPLFNKSAFVGETIAALASQDPPPAELIVVDDASTDGSVAACRHALARHADAFSGTVCQVIESSENQGPSHARNLGLARAKAPWVCFQDADDCFLPEALNRIRSAIREHQPAMMVLGYQSDPAGESFPDLAALEGEWEALAPGLLRLLTPLLTVTGSAFFMGRASNVVVRREHLGSLRFAEDARLNEGIDFWYRVLRQALDSTPTATIALWHEPMIRFRLLADSLSHQRPRSWRDLPEPPSIARYIDSRDPFDQRLIRTLAERWCDHANWALHDATELEAFYAAHAALLRRLGLDQLQRGAQ